MNSSFFRFRVFLSFLLALLAVSPRLFAADPTNAAPAPPSFGWPLEVNYGISATFGESREDHFHGGIDLSTNGETGLPVLAVADGNVYRLKVQERAYGNALYILHENGWVSVYAHLQRYSSELGLQQVYEDQVKQTGNRYPGDIMLANPVPVKKGETVAYSGESGVGFPHLHLEIRRNEETPVNPLENGFSDTQDTVPPVFEAAYLYPAGSGSVIDQEMDTETVRLQRTESGYIGDHVPVLRGDFFVSVSAYDPALRPYHRSPEKFVYSLDGKPLYAVQFNRFSYSQPDEFGLVYDLGKPGPSYFELPVVLNNRANIPLPFVVNSVPFSTSTLAPGPHRIEIMASDVNQNNSTATLDFTVNHPPTIRVQEVTSDGSDLIVSSDVSDPDWEQGKPASLAADVEYSVDDGKTFHSFLQSSLDTQSAGTTERVMCRVPMSDIAAAARVLLKARAYDGIEYSSYSVVPVTLDQRPQIAQLTGIPTGRLNLVTYTNALKVVFDSPSLLPSPLSLHVDPGAESVPMQSWDLSSYQAFVPAPRINGTISLSLPGNVSVSKPVNYVLKNSAATIQGDNFQLQIDPGSIYWDTFIWTEGIREYRARYLPVIGSMLQLGPRGLPLQKKSVLTFQYPAETEHPERLSVYRWDRSRQKWRCLVSTVDTKNRQVGTSISYLDLYALIYDNVAPTTSPVFPRRGSVTRNATPKLAMEVRDAGMDVNDDRVTFYVDGHAYQADYDPDRNLATATVDTPLKKGYHRFYAVAYDWGGNRTESTRITFRVR